MTRHFIILASAYTLGTRIALDYIIEDDSQMDLVKADKTYILNMCGHDTPLSSHFIQMDKAGWDEVVKKDKFFDGVKVISTVEEFAKILKEDRKLKGIDVAKYILTKVPCTHLKLEKLVYLCYADYLCAEGEKLFEDKILAYRYGPVVESVYHTYKRVGTEMLEDDQKTYDEKARELPIRSRIISAEHGIKKLISIDETLKKYGSMSAYELVDLTHRSSSPWSRSGAGLKENGEIFDAIIKEYHKYEEI